MQEPKIGVKIPYINYKGEYSVRWIEPMKVGFTDTSYHGECYTITAFDLNKQEKRKFSLQDVIKGSILATLKQMDIVVTQERVNGIYEKIVGEKL